MAYLLFMLLLLSRTVHTISTMRLNFRKSTSVSMRSLSVEGFIDANKLYSEALKDFPLVVNVASATMLAAGADIFIQTIERKRNRQTFLVGSEALESLLTLVPKNLQKQAAVAQVSMKCAKIIGGKVALGSHSNFRTFKVAYFAIIVNGLLLSKWLDFLHRTIPSLGMESVLLKVFLNQAIMVPAMHCLQVGSNIFLNGNRGFDTAGVKGKIKYLINKITTEIIPVTSQSLLFWGLIQFVNFSLLPLSYHQLVTNLAYVLWSTSTSLKPTTPIITRSWTRR